MFQKNSNFLYKKFTFFECDFFDLSVKENILYLWHAFPET